MELNRESKRLNELQGKNRKVPITIMLAPEVLRLVDESAQLAHLSRGDFLGACFIKSSEVKEMQSDNVAPMKSIAQIKREKLESQEEFRKNITPSTILKPLVTASPAIIAPPPVTEAEPEWAEDESEDDYKIRLRAWHEKEGNII